MESGEAGKGIIPMISITTMLSFIFRELYNLFPLISIGSSSTINCFFCIIAFDLQCLSGKLMTMHFQTSSSKSFTASFFSASFEGIWILHVSSHHSACHLWLSVTVSPSMDICHLFFNSSHVPSKFQYEEIILVKLSKWFQVVYFVIWIHFFTIISSMFPFLAGNNEVTNILFFKYSDIILRNSEDLTYKSICCNFTTFCVKSNINATFQRKL